MVVQTAKASEKARIASGNNEVFTGTGNSTGLLDRLSPEVKRADELKIRMDGNKKLERIVGAFGKFSVMEWKYGAEADHKDALSCLGRIDCSAADVESFVRLFPALSVNYVNREMEIGFRDTAGIFLSAMINSSSGTEFAIDLPKTGDRDLKYNLCYLGALCKQKRILLKGNSAAGLGYSMDGGAILVRGGGGLYAGKCMKSGKIIIFNEADDWTGRNMSGGLIAVRGNAGHGTGTNMRGGTIIVMGSCGHSTGMGMEGGKIAIFGNAGTEFGNRMAGGEIHVFGKIGGLADDIEGGNIWQGRRQIVKDGKIIAEPDRE